MSCQPGGTPAPSALQRFGYSCCPPIVAWTAWAVLTQVASGSALTPLGEDAVVWLNFPAANAEPVLAPIDGAPALKVAAKTESRAAYLLRGLPAGQHRWSVRFPTP